jgi:hypothetical protein
MIDKVKAMTMKAMTMKMIIDEIGRCCDDKENPQQTHQPASQVRVLTGGKIPACTRTCGNP